MDRLTRERIEALHKSIMDRYLTSTANAYPQAVEDLIAYRDLALQSLSQEAVRDEALEEAAKVCDAQNTKMSRYCADLIRALKREPNAAEDSGDWPNFSSEAERYAPDYDDGDPARWPPSGPAAPDVVCVVKRLEMLYNFKLPAAGGQILPLEGGYRLTAPAESFEVLREAAALLSRLGQGWVPVDRTAEYQEHHFKVDDVGVAWNGNRVWVCADSGALLRAKVIGEKLFVEFTPPSPERQ